VLVKKLVNQNLFLLSTLTILFFSLNSIFCKAALQNNSIDPYSFSFFRLFFGVITLFLISLFINKKNTLDLKSNWLNGFFLFLYAICFSFSYISLDAGLGALILFAVVQITMILFAFIKKEKFGLKKLIGISLALCGLFFLLYPSKDFSISIFHFILMVIAGFAWAFYTLLGRNSTNAIKDTSNNFFKAFIITILFVFLFIDDLNITSSGLFWAFLSGAIASGLGYSIWYFVLKDLKIVTASVLQLLVPVISIFISIIFLDEKLTISLLVSTILVLGGIFISLKEKN
jgi:drug/metabolite transporter (DMT)-like permease